MATRRVRAIIGTAGVALAIISALAIALADDESPSILRPGTVVLVQPRPGVCRTLPLSSIAEARRVTGALLQRSSQARTVRLAWIVSLPRSRRIPEVAVALRTAGYRLTTRQRTPAMRVIARIQTSARALLRSQASVNRLAGGAQRAVVGLASPPNACDGVREKLGPQTQAR